jgi:hypothetical protein
MACPKDELLIQMLYLSKHILVIQSRIAHKTNLVLSKQLMGHGKCLFGLPVLAD